MTSAPPRDPSAPPRSAGSDPAAPPEQFTCEVCQRTFQHKIALFNHRKSHDKAPGEGLGVEPEIKVRKTAKLSTKELDALQGELAENVRAVGGMLHAGLIGLKLLKLQNPEARFSLPGTRIDLPIPSFDTHLPYTLISRSELTAKVLVDHAAENESLLRWLIRFNGWFKGGEVGQLVGAHAAAAVLSLGVQNPVLGTAAGALIGDVVAQVTHENAELRHQVAHLRAQAAARPPDDERGAGS